MRFEPDLTGVAAGFTMFSKGNYEFIIGEPKAFMRQNRKGQDTYGVRWNLRLAEDVGSYKKDARQMYTGYLHSEGAQGFVKGFVMSALGYNPRNVDEEKKFDEKYKGQDWSIDPETGAVGDIYRETLGKRIVAIMDVGINEENGEPTQQFKGFTTVAANAARAEAPAKAREPVTAKR